MKIEITMNDSVALRAIGALTLLVEDANTPVTDSDRNDLATLLDALQVWRRRRLEKPQPVPVDERASIVACHDRWLAAYRWHLAHHKPVAQFPHATKVSH
jgi:hypothetical protein